jgi:hypothetical protein
MNENILKHTDYGILYDNYRVGLACTGFDFSVVAGFSCNRYPEKQI